jgi:hypothetical protein
MDSLYRKLVIVPILIAASAVAAAATLTSDWPAQKLHADDASNNAGLGRAAFVAGDTAFVGEPNEQGPGSVYVFEQSSGAWSQTQKLSPDASPPGADFGYAVAFDGTTAIIGAPFTTLTDDGLRHQGAAYVFTKTGGVWSEAQKLVASDFGPENQFGNAVAISGDTLLVAAYNAPIGGNVYQGAVYVFTRSGDTWTEAQKLTASDGAPNDDFGYAIALAGTTAVVSSPYAAGANAMQGAAYVFASSGGTWSETQKLIADDGQAWDDFGSAIGFDGTTLAIGAQYAAVGDNAGQGAAYVFASSGGTWSQVARLSSSDGAASDAFGESIAAAGTTIVAGAPFATIGANFGQGAAYVFSGSGADWTETAKLVADDGASSDDFGYALATDGTLALVGSPFAAIGDNTAAGAAYLFSAPSADAIFADGFDGTAP